VKKRLEEGDGGVLFYRLDVDDVIRE